MALKGLPTMKSIFRSSFDDNQVGIFRGRRRPNEPENPQEASEWFFEDNFDGTSLNLQNWTLTTSGTGSTHSVANGVLTLTSGTADDAYSKIYSKINFSKINVKGPMTVEFRARANYSAAGKQEWFIGVADANPAYLYSATVDSFAAGYNQYEPDLGVTDNWTAVQAKVGLGANLGTAAGAGFSYEDNTWHIYKLEISGARNMNFYIDGKQAINFNSSVADQLDTNTDFYLLLATYTRGNPSAAQTLEIDYIKFKYAS